MRVYSARLPVQDSAPVEQRWPGGEGANVQAAIHDSSHLKDQPRLVPVGWAGDHGRNPIRVSSKRLRHHLENIWGFSAK